MARERKQIRKGEEGSALTEAAIIIPVLILIVYWSSAMTDVMILKIKAQEAARFALWELTVFRDPAAIAADTQARFADLKSPTAAQHNGRTGLMMYPKAADLSWNVSINPTYQKVTFGGGTRLPTGGPIGAVLGFVNQIVNFLSRAVDGAVQSEKFNMNGSGAVSVSLAHAYHNGSIILNGGDLAGHKSNGDDMKADAQLNDLSFSAPLSGEKPLRLVYDSWKAWPKPRAYTTNGASGPLTDPSVSPQHTYPVVESMVSQQVNQIAFFGLNRLSFFNQLNTVLGQILSSGISQLLLGGDLPTFFTTAPMDHALNNVTANGIPGNRGFGVGPITILPVGAPDASFVPGGGLLTNRLGDLGSNNTSVTTIDDLNGLGAGADQSRYTVPYRINSKWWTANGGIGADNYNSSVSSPPSSITTGNNYVKAYACRGHYFGGARNAQVSDATQRFSPSCPY